MHHRGDGDEGVSDFVGAEQLIDRVVAAFGRLDIVVNNAGIVRDAMVFNLSEDVWGAVLRVHLKGTFAVTHHRAAAHWRTG